VPRAPTPVADQTRSSGQLDLDGAARFPARIGLPEESGMLLLTVAWNGMWKSETWTRPFTLDSRCFRATDPASPMAGIRVSRRSDGRPDTPDLKFEIFNPR
jgi:hypothetical protein